MLDPVEFGKSMAAIVKDATAPLLRRIEDQDARIKELEARQPERGADGKDGTSVTIADVEPMLAEMVGRAVAAIPAPKDGADGKDAEPIDVHEVVRELIACDEIKTILDPMTAEAVAKHMAENPVQNGKDGAPGRDGKDGERGPQGEKGMDGSNGRDGLDVKDLFRADGGRLVAVMSDGSTKDLGEFVGKDGRDGKDGKDGRDGLGFEDCTVEAGDGVATLKFVRGDVVKSVCFPIPDLKHVGFWGPGAFAKAGQFTTHDGHLWMARRDTNETPSYQAKDWQMAARRGTDGQRGPAGKDYKPREPVQLSRLDSRKD